MCSRIRNSQQITEFNSYSLIYIQVQRAFLIDTPSFYVPTQADKMREELVNLNYCAVPF